MKCPCCKKIVEDKGEFCPYCGNSLEQRIKTVTKNDLLLIGGLIIVILVTAAGIEVYKKDLWKIGSPAQTESYDEQIDDVADEISKQGNSDNEILPSKVVWTNNIGLQTESEIYGRTMNESEENIWDECIEPEFSMIDLDMDGKLELIREGKYKKKDGKKIAIYYYDETDETVKQIGVIETDTYNSSIFMKDNQSFAVMSVYKNYQENDYYSLAQKSISKSYSIIIETIENAVNYIYKNNGEHRLLLQLSYDEWKAGNWDDKDIRDYLGELQNIEFEPVLKEKCVSISVHGKEYGEYFLDEDQEIKIGDTNVCKIEDGMCKMTEANCPNQVCVNSGSIQNRGECIVCLPNGIIITIEKVK